MEWLGKGVDGILIKLEEGDLISTEKTGLLVRYRDNVYKSFDLTENELGSGRRIGAFQYVGNFSSHSERNWQEYRPAK